MRARVSRRTESGPATARGRYGVESSWGLSSPQFRVAAQVRAWRESNHWLTLRRAACETEADGIRRQFRRSKFNEQESRVRIVISASRTIVASARRAGASMREARLPFDLAGRSHVDARDARPRPSRMPGADGG